MGLLSDEDKKYVKEMFEKGLKDPVRILVFKQGSWKEFSSYHQILEELKQLSGGKVSYKIIELPEGKDLAREYGVDKAPMTVILGRKDYGVRFAGTPFGYEFSAFLEAIINVSKGDTDLPEEIKEKLKEVQKPVKIQVFVTPNCPYCPMAVITAHKFAIESDNIVAEGVESYEFPELANRFRVQAVPKIVINEGKSSFVGAMPPQEFLKAILKAIARGLETSIIFLLRSLAAFIGFLAPYIDLPTMR